ncbi:TonB-dependent receptor domain-containing protein [Sphingobacterium sp.]|uniref:TonB-dependent receptor domain-containing protein n=1 Tax=Sphingobacterium sp. TaxID=341027 RepID=UPI00289D15D4|nr:TonB-dependent receptor [Sphingobacterium sp.]
MKNSLLSRTLIMLVCCMHISFLFGQEKAGFLIEGIAKDVDKEPVKFATITLISERNNMVVKGVLTSENGSFRILNAPKGAYFIQISSVGYKTSKQRLQIDQDTAVSFMDIEREENNLGEVLVQRSIAKPLIEQRSDRYVMNVGSSVLASGNNLYEVILMAPAVSQVGDDLNIRGKRGILVVLNGKVIPNGNIKTVLSGIPADQIDKIEVITAPSAKYDAVANGGVIEIYTKNKTNSNGILGNVSGNISQGRKFGGGGNAGIIYHSDKIEFNVNGSYNAQGTIEKGGFNRKLYNNFEEIGFSDMRKDLSGEVKSGYGAVGLNYFINTNSKIGVDVSAVNVDIDVSGRLITDIMKSGIPSSNPLNSSVAINTRLRTAGLLYQYVFDTLGTDLNIASSYNKYTSQQHQDFVETNANSKFNKIKSNFDIYTVAIDHKKVFNANHQLEVGVKNTYTKNNSLEDMDVTQRKENINNGYKEDILAGYINYNFDISPKLSMQVGVRGENTDFSIRDGKDSSYFNLFPKARFDYQVSKKYAASLIYGRTIDRPGYDLLIPYTRYFDTNSGQQGNPGLRPEYSQTITLSNTISDFNIALEYSYTKDAIAGYIFFDPLKSFYTHKTINYNRRELLSINLSSPIQFGKRIKSYVEVSGFYQMNEIPDPRENRILEKNNFYVNLRLNGTIMLGKGYDGEISGYYTTKRISGIYTYDDISNVSFGIRKSILNKKGFIKLDVSDAFYSRITRYKTDIIPIAMRGTSRNDSQRIRLTMGYKFNKNNVKSKSTSNDSNKAEIRRLGL